jgi:alkylation response protein AidB-like acyl-CoA dehydrogenase
MREATTPSEFRRQVEQWFEEHAPKKGSAADFSTAHIVSGTSVEEFQHNERQAFDMTKRWQRTLFDAGLVGRSWPDEYGGQSAPAWQDEVVAEVQSSYGVSTKMAAVALEMVPSVLFEHGTHEQRLTHLPSVVRGNEGWCQLLSEPDAGSDLGSVRTSALPVEGGWSVQGQKVWTSGAGCASFALLLARTEPAVVGMAGLSCLILDMSDPGVRVRPLRQMSGGYHFNEVFLDGVFVPATGLIGDLGGGRAVLRTMLASERAAIGGGTSARAAGQLLELASRLGRQRDARVRQALALAVVRERVLDLTVARLGAGAPIPAGGPVTKLLYSEHARRTADTALDLLGATATVLDGPEAGPWQDRFLFAPGLRLGGGTDEIQRTTIAERGLGLPREPAAPRGEGHG